MTGTVAWGDWLGVDDWGSLLRQPTGSMPGTFDLGD
ncbi:capsid/nuclear shuttle family protein [Amycolatopsis dendrobii]|nr:capsid/nuclear shuttle family protein [Amycolatopsis dendrobii]